MHDRPAPGSRDGRSRKIGASGIKRPSSAVQHESKFCRKLRQPGIGDQRRVEFPHERANVRSLAALDAGKRTRRDVPHAVVRDRAHEAGVDEPGRKLSETLRIQSAQLHVGARGDFDDSATALTRQAAERGKLGSRNEAARKTNAREQPVARLDRVQRPGTPKIRTRRHTGRCAQGNRGAFRRILRSYACLPGVLPNAKKRQAKQLCPFPPSYSSLRSWSFSHA